MSAAAKFSSAPRLQHQALRQPKIVAALDAPHQFALVRKEQRPLGIYAAGPAAFFVALGHRWNAMPMTQLHELVAGTASTCRALSFRPKSEPSELRR